MIVLRNIWFRYSKKTPWVLREVNLSMPSKGVVVVVGPNASGKTTLLKLLGLIYRPTRGQVLVDNLDVWSTTKENRLKARRKIVYVHEKPIMLRGSILDNISYGLRLRALSREKALEKALKIARTLGLDNIAEANARTISRGQAQLVAIARALAVEPSTLLLDEPFAHLDSNASKKLFSLIESLGERILIVMATHNYYLAAKLATRVIYIKDGTVKEASKSILEF